jgi:uncharacterized protein
MPEYLAPGVFVEEVSYRAKSIEGVGTTTTGFVGPTRTGPTGAEPELLTSLTEFEAAYGDGGDLHGGPNYLWHAARAFFEQGGSRLYVSRVVGAGAARAAGDLGDVALTAAHPGAAANDWVVRLTLRAGPDVVTQAGRATGLREGDVVLHGTTVRRAVRAGGGLALQSASGQPEPVADLEADDTVRVLTAAIEVEGTGFGAADLRVADLLALLGDGAPVAAEEGTTAFTLVAGIAEAAGSTFAARLTATTPTPENPTPGVVVVEVPLDGGADGDAPGIGAYTGVAEDPGGLEALELVEEIAIVAAPAASAGGADLAAAVAQALVGHCERMQYRVAILDSRPGLDLRGVQAQRAAIDSTRAAFYYPWVRIADPFGAGTVDLPPSGFVAGVWARTDRERAVWKAPANEVVLGALGFERPIGTAQQEVLNPLGINCLRSFEGRGHRIWGARTASSDPEWKYLNVRRYFVYLERSIDRGTQWAVFEPNGEALWANVRRTISDFLFGEFQAGALLGAKPEAAYFVKCDRSTMTQNDLDNGRLVCQVGVAALRPAEFVVFRVGQWTGDRRN